MPEVRAQILISVKDDASAKLQGIGKSGAAMGGELKKGLGGAVQALTGLSLSSIGVAGAITGVALALKYSVEQAAEAQKIMAQTEAVIKSTEGAAGLTAEAIGEMADRLSKLNAVDDETVQKGANVLLTFKSIKKDAFEPAMQAAIDMSTALGTNLQGALIQVGKALESPSIGLTALRRSGVSFNAEQIKVIKNLEATGRLAEAQTLILEELNKEFGGSGAAAAGTYAGQLELVKINVGNLAESLGTQLLPSLTNVLKLINDNIDADKAWADSMEAGTATIWDRVAANAIMHRGGKRQVVVLAVLHIRLEENKFAFEGVTDRGSELSDTFERELTPAFYDAAEAEYQLLTASDGVYEAMLRQQEAGAVLAAGLSGELKNAQEDYQQVIADTQPEIDKLTAQISKYQSMQGQTITVTEDATTSATEYELAQIRAATAAQKLAEFTGESREEFLELKLASESAAEKVVALGEGFWFSRDMTLDYTKKIQESNLSLGELYQKQADAEAQLKLTTAQFIFQKLSADLDNISMLQLAEKMGILSKADADAALSIEAINAEFKKTGDVENYKSNILDVQAAIDALHDRHIEITIDTIRTERINQITSQYLESTYGPGGPGGGGGGGGGSNTVPGPGQYLTGPGLRAPALSTSAARNGGAMGGGAMEALLVTLPGAISRAVRDGLQGARI